MTTQKHMPNVLSYLEAIPPEIIKIIIKHLLPTSTQMLRLTNYKFTRCIEQDKSVLSPISAILDTNFELFIICQQSLIWFDINNYITSIFNTHNIDFITRTVSKFDISLHVLSDESLVSDKYSSEIHILLACSYLKFKIKLLEADNNNNDVRTFCRYSGMKNIDLVKYLVNEGMILKECHVYMVLFYGNIESLMWVKENINENIFQNVIENLGTHSIVPRSEIISWLYSNYYSKFIKTPLRILHDVSKNIQEPHKPSFLRKRRLGENIPLLISEKLKSFTDKQLSVYIYYDIINDNNLIDIVIDDEGDDDTYSHYYAILEEIGKLKDPGALYDYIKLYDAAKDASDDEDMRMVIYNIDWFIIKYMNNLVEIYKDDSSNTNERHDYTLIDMIISKGYIGIDIAMDFYRRGAHQIFYHIVFNLPFGYTTIDQETEFYLSCLDNKCIKEKVWFNKKLYSVWAIKYCSLEYITTEIFDPDYFDLCSDYMNNALIYRDLKVVSYVESKSSFDKYSLYYGFVRGSNVADWVISRPYFRKYSFQEAIFSFDDIKLLPYQPKLFKQYYKWLASKQLFLDNTPLDKLPFKNKTIINYYTKATRRTT